MFDGPLMFPLNSPVVDTIHSQSNKFATGVKTKATGELKLNESPGTVSNTRVYSRPLNGT